METYVLNLLALSSLSLLLYGVAKAFYIIWWKPKWLERNFKRQGIRGTLYRPLVGDVKEFVRMITEAWTKPLSLTHEIVPRVDPFTLATVQKYGNISVVWFGTTPRLIINDPELIKEILSNKLGHFSKPYISPIIRILTKAGLTVLDGEEWATHRRIINPAFHLERLKEMIPAFTVSCGKMIGEWKSMVTMQGTCEVDMWVEFQKLTADVISRAAFGSSYEEGKMMFELQKELILLTLEAMQSVYIPGLRFVPTKKNRRRKQLDKEITSILRKIVESKMNAMRTGQSKVDDLLGLLLQSNNQNSLPEHTISKKSNGMTLEEVIEECKQFYLAGQETTSTWLTWTIIVLAMHPEWQEKARDEILEVCGKKEPSFEDISHLKIVTMILNEVLRLYPPVIAQYQHAYKETKIGHITIPAGVDLNLPTLLLHHDPELWGEDAEEFKPERFSEGISKACKDQLAFFPFGWGPRTCIGQNFAMIEAKIAVATILQHFSLELSPSYTHAPYTVMTLQPQHGAHVKLHKL
ncbi:cytochrome P450 CYP72A616-like [Humulus lupulus]|uniref:cytochrome P450 CYP72A616-like n=1 Tax=Humulus lupulus TaxID=3486 RepID=UPI002B40B66C|nr:cytochrome P450 CYP72A616-like [Humulus lupulus]